MATELGLATGNNQNVQQYALGGGAVAHQNGANSGAAQNGSNGSQPGATELVGALAALDPVDLFNILCIPRTDQLPDDEAFTVISEGIGYCARRRAFMIVDVPQADITRDEITEIEAWLDENATLRHENAALYFPRPRVPDPLNEFRLRSFPASGTIAGLYARIDGARGVWKAPAGLEAQLRGVQELELKMTDEQNGVINPDRHQRPANLPERGQRLLGCTDARRRRPACLRMEVRSCAAIGFVPRGEPVPRYPVRGL